MPRPEHAPLVGRKAELALLTKIVGAASKGAGSAVFLAGEGGIGKTVLATAVAERAEAQGWRAATGRAYPVETGVPYAVFADALLPLVRSLEPSTLAVLTRGGAAELGYIFPNLGLSGDRERASAGATPSELKARVLWNFTQFLGRLASKQPLLLVLENLQWADTSSVELLHFVARQVSDQKIVLLGTYNETERDLNPVLRSTEQSLLRLGTLVVHRLGPLTKADVDDVVARRFGLQARADEQFSGKLYEWTRGNPFFLEETLKSLVESGAITERGGQFTGWETEALRVPTTIREVLAARADRLSANGRGLANLAAVIGTRAAHDTLASVSGLAEMELIAALEELLAQRIIEESGSVDDI